MATFNFLEQAIIEQVSDYINKNAEMHDEDCITVEVEKDDICYFVDVECGYEYEGYMEEDTNGWIQTNFMLDIDIASIGGCDEWNNEVEDFPSIRDYEVRNAIIRNVA